MRKFLIISLLSTLAFTQVQAETPVKDPENWSLHNALVQPSPMVEEYPLNREELIEFYEARQYRSAWDTSSKGNREALKSFIASMDSFASYHGLRTEKYPSKLMEKLLTSTNSDDEIKLELLVTESLLRLAHDLHGDSVNLNHLYPGWSFAREKTAIAEGLEKAVEASNVHDYITGLAPQTPAYIRLSWELKVYRKLAQKSPWPTVASGPALLPGDQSPRIVQLRERLKVEDYLPSTDIQTVGNNIYDENLRKVVINYQMRNGLKADGEIGKKTIAALNTTPQSRVDQILANMERLRHMPEIFPLRYAVVNIADASIDVFDDGKPIYHGPVIVGRPDRKTPFIDSEIRSVIFNPAWHVPSKIARKDILPKLRKDPHYLEKMGFVINNSAEDPFGEAVDWKKIKESEFKFRLRQAPGDLNSLGRLKFDFDNDFSVYMHGTPHQELFEKSDRTLSSGCVRLRDPDQFAVLVLSKNQTDWNIDRVRETVDKHKTKWQHVEEPLPIYFQYWTVFANADGDLSFRDDVYGYDSLLIEWMQKNDYMESQELISPPSEDKQASDI